MYDATTRFAHFVITEDAIGLGRRNGDVITFNRPWPTGPSHTMDLFDDDGILMYRVRYSAADDIHEEVAEVIHEWGAYDAGVTYSTLDGESFIG